MWRKGGGLGSRGSSSVWASEKQVGFSGGSQPEGLTRTTVGQSGGEGSGVAICEQ